MKSSSRNFQSRAKPSWKVDKRSQAELFVTEATQFCVMAGSTLIQSSSRAKHFIFWAFFGFVLFFLVLKISLPKNHSFNNKKQYYLPQRTLKIEWKCRENKGKKSDWKKSLFSCFWAEINFSSWTEKVMSWAELSGKSFSLSYGSRQIGLDHSKPNWFTVVRTHH